MPPNQNQDFETTMSDNQEPEMPINNNHQEDLHDDLSFLRLNSFNSTTNHHHQPCTNCGCTTTTNNPMKRPSPENPTTNSEPKSKKVFLESQQHNFNLHGFTKMTLPLFTPVLGRSISDPQSPPENDKVMGGNVVTPSSSSAAKGRSSALPPLPLSLRRSVSDPIPSPAKTFSSSNETVMEESPNYMRLKRMKDCMREMGQWLDVFMHEDEAVSTEDNATTQDNTETEYEEAVSVERAGESLIIHFKCPCGKGYNILLSGRSCYYKLI